MELPQQKPEFALLTRDQFRENVFKRDDHKCVICGDLAKDAHHILERRLWSDGGYYVNNGASLCEEHHILAESTEISCDLIREKIGITKFPLPDHLYKDQQYDKWGNPILPSGRRLKGELYDDPSVQKILKPVIHLFTDRVKYPRTYHLPWSPGTTSDDRVLSSFKSFENKEVVITAKMDGENTTMYNDYLHARSIEYESHPSRSWIKALHGKFAHDIPHGWRVCGENLYAKHSIKYENLIDYFLVFSIWNSHVCLSWDATVEWVNLLGLKTVPVLYEGVWNEKLVKNLRVDTLNGDPCEGYVVRVREEFTYRDFKHKVAKFVRANHVQSHGHWMRSKLELNQVKA